MINVRLGMSIWKYRQSPGKTLKPRPREQALTGKHLKFCFSSTMFVSLATRKHVLNKHFLLVTSLPFYLGLETMVDFISMAISVGHLTSTIWKIIANLQWNRTRRIAYHFSTFSQRTGMKISQACTW